MSRIRPISLELAILFLLSLSNNSVFAQHNHRFFYGTVAVEGTKQGIRGVNLKIEGTNIGTVTDKSGNFSFFTDTLPAKLSVSHVGFDTRLILLDETSYRLSIYLKRSVRELKEVEIKANFVEPYFKDPQYAVLDYDIDSNLVWLLVFRQRISKAELICKNLTGDTLAVSGSISFRPTGLFRDCIGTLHLLSRDSGFQVYRIENRIQFIHGVKLKKFEDVLKNCVASTAKTLFFKKITDKGLSVEFYGVNRETMVRQTISRVADEKKLRMKRRNQEDNYLLMNMRVPDSRDDFVNWNYIHKVLYRPVRAHLCLVGSYTCIFNTPDRQIEFYDEDGNYSLKLALLADKVSEGRWTMDIAIDPITQKAYTTFLRNGSCTLYEIDLNNGSLKKKSTLTHPFPEKIRVYNDWVYYLFDVSAEADNKMLFRQRL